MFKREAEWLGGRMAAYPAEEIAPVINIGGSSRHFRTITQPWIEGALFGPLAARGVAVHHLDVEPGEGVDLVCDLLTEEGFAMAKALNPGAVLLCNVLEHVEQPAPLAQACLRLRRPGGRLIVTVPHSYPMHRAPIDTMFRPTPQKIAALLPGVPMEHGSIERMGNHWDEVFRAPKKLSIKKAPWLLKPYLTSIAVFRA
jgi:SAM-dependent methyltransferase